MNQELGFSYTILNDSYAIGCGTLAFGAFLLIPFALKYGRRPIYIVSTALQLGVSIWSAKLQTVADIMLINAFSCLLGALAEVICNMTIADVYSVHQRGRMTSFYVWVTNVGGSLAPVAAVYITRSQGWRWVWSVRSHQVHNNKRQENSADKTSSGSGTPSSLALPLLHSSSATRSPSSAIHKTRPSHWLGSLSHPVPLSMICHKVKTPRL